MEEILPHLGCMKPFEETTYQLAQVFFLPTVCYSMYSFLNWWCLLDLQYTSSPFKRSLWDIRHPIGPGVVSWLVSAPRYVNSPTGTGNLVGKRRAKGASFRLCWWGRYHTFTVRENSGKHTLMIEFPNQQHVIPSFFALFVQDEMMMFRCVFFLTWVTSTRTNEWV